MILLENRHLPQPASDALAAWQAEVDGAGDYAARVEAARTEFARRNRRGNDVFDVVKAELALMCSGARRCAYCEDSVADEVEHVRPKTIYPEFVFAWMNYVYACGSCNGPKNNKCAVIRAGEASAHVISRRRNEALAPPPDGIHALIDPRTEDAREFMELDLRTTFYFTPTHAEGTIEHERAKYTIGTLQLNARDFLPIARHAAFADFKAHMRAYQAERDAGTPTESLQRIVTHVRTRQHATVWSEMKRQRDRVVEIAPLFAALPEAIDW